MSNGTVTLPASVAGSWAGVDAGATLCKLCSVPDPESFRVASFDSTDLTGVHRTLTGWNAKKIVATGCGAPRVAREAAAEVQVVTEFDAWAAGARLLAHREGISVPKQHLVVSLGTGTSILLVGRGAGPERVGGTGLGGGSLVGLGKLLLGVDTFREIVELAEQGDRRRVDLLVGDIYASDAPPLAAELNAASFGKLQAVKEAEPADVAHALCGLIGENIALLTAQLARQHGAQTILFCGSTLDQNRPLRQILVGTSRMTGLDAHLVEAGAYAGALGALSLAQG